jgi:hypothetical protein
MKVHGVLLCFAIDGLRLVLLWLRGGKDVYDDSYVTALGSKELIWFV